ncbi:glycosyl transferase family 1 [Mycobacterium sp. GA-1285]|uniref:glycosyltransferase n=1 Tax=Mycobacterium sp. GA-1285 TaxID=1772282 RepID=UPI0007460EE9|nr:glycosyltransferase [Mycobacterium sp. GA-1285]KUI15609.1 glycosyl transferase family 1 [Mycobacterium sp. GA-1285]
MKFVLASYGTRGDVEPCVAIGAELLRRGHEVQMAVPPDLIGVAEAAGLEAVASGLDSRAALNAYRDFWTAFFRSFWRVRYLRKLWRELREPVIECSWHISRTLSSLADGADVLFTGLAFEHIAANVSERYEIPLATLHYVPVRANGQLVPAVLAPLARSAMTSLEWLDWLFAKKVDDAQRRELGLPPSTAPYPRRMARRGALEIQAYDEVCFPGLATEWVKWDGKRPFVGALTIEAPTDADQEVMAWIAAGPPPIFFGFGSMPVDSGDEMIAMISAACAQLGKRGLICSGWSDFSSAARTAHVKVVPAVNFAAIFPSCRAVVHHGGAGTTAVGLRAGIPTLVLSMDVSQTIWGAQIKRLKVGTTRRFSTTTEATLIADLRTVLAPEYAARAREVARQMTEPATGIAAAADHLEDLARQTI